MCWEWRYSRILEYINLKEWENGLLSKTTLTAHQREYKLLYRHSDSRYSERKAGRQTGLKQSISLQACTYWALSQSADSDLVCSNVLVVISTRVAHTYSRLLLPYPLGSLTGNACPSLYTSTHPVRFPRLLCGTILLGITGWFQLGLQFLHQSLKVTHI